MIPRNINKFKNIKILIIILLILSIPISIIAGLSSLLVVKYETSEGHFPSYIDKTSIPSNNLLRKQYLKEIEEELIWKGKILLNWWIIAIIFLAIFFFKYIRSKREIT
jgi:hypothetical protein